MLFRVAPPRYLPADKHIQWQGCLQLRPILPRQMPACKNITCGRRGCTAGSSHIMATCVKKQRTAERLANCFGRSLIFFPHHRLMMLPRVWVNSSGTAVSSRFNSRGTFPAALAFWHNHWHHFQVNVASFGGGGKRTPFTKGLRMSIPPTPRGLHTTAPYPRVPR